MPIQIWKIYDFLNSTPSPGVAALPPPASGHLEKPRFLGRLMMQLPDLTKADFSNLRFFEVPIWE